MTPEALHAHHHALIEDRIAVFRNFRTRNNNDRIRKKGARRQAIWKLQSHLRSLHGLEGGFEPLEEIIARHEKLHEEEAK